MTFYCTRLTDFTPQTILLLLNKLPLVLMGRGPDIGTRLWFVRQQNTTHTYVMPALCDSFQFIASKLFALLVSCWGLFGLILIQLCWRIMLTVMLALFNLTGQPDTTWNIVSRKPCTKHIPFSGNSFLLFTNCCTYWLVIKIPNHMQRSCTVICGQLLHIYHMSWSLRILCDLVSAFMICCKNRSAWNFRLWQSYSTKPSGLTYGKIHKCDPYLNIWFVFFTTH